MHWYGLAIRTVHLMRLALKQLARIGGMQSLKN